jgi:SAM-dependent methyltransferase
MARTAHGDAHHVIGQATASLYSAPRRLLQRAWGAPNIDTRQKWAVVWPVLEELPRSRLRLLDAGCGDGTWTLEIAARRPEWTLVGIDRDPDQIACAVAAARRLACSRVGFEAIDFLAFQPPHQFDTVLSVASAHYAVEALTGPALFAKFAEWIAPGGWLILYGPRRSADVPVVRGLPPPFTMRNVLSVGDLSDLCRAAGLDVEDLRGVVGRPGTLAKQVGRAAGDSIAGRAIAYPVQLMLAALDRLSAPKASRTPSASLLLVARKPVQPIIASSG